MSKPRSVIVVQARVVSPKIVPKWRDSFEYRDMNAAILYRDGFMALVRGEPSPYDKVHGMAEFADACVVLAKHLGATYELRIITRTTDAHGVITETVIEEAEKAYG